MKTHVLKLEEQYADDVLSGDKNFEIRFNDRAFQKGDHIKFNVINDLKVERFHELNKKEYEITYVLSYFGLKDNYVALAIKEV